jgi:phosphohistidine phosphatase
LDDFDRPLNHRGEKNAPFMAKVLLEKQIFPDFFLSSPAKRAKTTAEIFAHTLSYSQEIVFNQALYLASTQTLLSILQSTSNEYNTIFVFGHNPELTQFANELSGEEIENIPTCGVVGFELFENNWNSLKANSAKLVFFEYPKKYN